jgi:hypothetical protein
VTEPVKEADIRPKEAEASTQPKVGDSSQIPVRADHQRAAHAEAERRQRADRERAAQEKADAPPQADPELKANAATSRIVFQGLLVLAVLDRIVRVGPSLDLLAVVRELHTGSAQVSYLFFTFLIGYLVCAPVAGLAIYRFGTRRMVGVGLFLSALATAWFAVATDLKAMFIARGLQGCGLSIAAPTFCTIFARFEEKRRAQANAVYQFVSSTTWVAFSTVSAAGLVAINWRAKIWVVAVAVGLFAAAWVAADRFAERFKQGQPDPIFRNSTALGCFAAYFGYSFCRQAILSSLIFSSLYEMRAAGISSAGMSAGLTLAVGISALLSGALLARLIASNVSATLLAAKRFVVGGLLLTVLSIAITIASRGSVFVCVTFAIGSCVGLGAVDASLWTILQTAAPTGNAGRWGGFQAAFGSLATIPFFFTSFRFIPGLWLAAAVALASAFASMRFIGAKPILERPFKRRPD